MSMPQWKGLFDWSIKYQDGTAPSDWNPSEYDPEKMKWLEGVLKHYMRDFGARMRQIKAQLDTGVVQPLGAAAGEQAAEEQPDGQQEQDQAQGVLSLQDKEQLLDELMDIVSSIDFAKDLHTIGGLSTLLELLGSTQPSLAWRAAEVVATCVANNPPVQQLFLEGGVLPRLLRLLDTPGTSEAQVLQRVKGLLALSRLVRHCSPALAALCVAGGVARLVALAGDADARVQRKALFLLEYVASQQLAAVVGDTGAVQAAHQALQSHHDDDGGCVAGSDVRQAALELLLQIGTAQEGWDALQRCTPLPASLAALQASLAALAPEDKECCQDEARAAEGLTCLMQGPRPAAPAPATQQGQAGAPAATGLAQQEPMLFLKPA